MEFTEQFGARRRGQVDGAVLLIGQHEPRLMMPEPLNSSRKLWLEKHVGAAAAAFNA